MTEHERDNAYDYTWGACTSLIHTFIPFMYGFGTSRRIESSPGPGWVTLPGMPLKYSWWLSIHYHWSRFNASKEPEDSDHESIAVDELRSSPIHIAQNSKAGSLPSRDLSFGSFLTPARPSNVRQNMASSSSAVKPGANVSSSKPGPLQQTVGGEEVFDPFPFPSPSTLGVGQNQMLASTSFQSVFKAVLE